MSQSLSYRVIRNPTFLIGLLIVLTVVGSCAAAPALTAFPPLEHDLASALQRPSRLHPLGTDEQGRDLLSRILYGGRNTLVIAVAGVVGALVVGAGGGIVAGYYGGRVDSLIMRSMDVLLAFPSILLAIAIIATVGVGKANIILAVGVYSVPQFARVARAAVLSVRKSEYVQAAVAVGVADRVILLRHVLPNAVSPILVQATFRMASAILTAASLSFLGLGVQPPEPEWGAILSVGRQYLRVAPHLSTFPGLAIFFTILGLNLMGDGLRDVLDPRLR